MLLDYVYTLQKDPPKDSEGLCNSIVKGY